MYSFFHFSHQEHGLYMEGFDYFPFVILRPELKTAFCVEKEVFATVYFSFPILSSLGVGYRKISLALLGFYTYCLWSFPGLIL